jgi:hypothetical protein
MRKSSRIKKKKNKRGTIRVPLVAEELHVLHCSPLVQKQPHVQGSCFTPSALRLVRDAYNKKHPRDPVLENASDAKLYAMMKEKMSPQCGDKENCWLNELDMPHLDEELFAPHQPASWKQKPTCWLSNFDISDVLKQYEKAYQEFHLMGPTVLDYDFVEGNGQCVEEEMCHLSLRDLVEKKKKTKLSIVFNLSMHNEPGTHWTTLFVDVADKFIYYYDSALNPVPAEITKFRKEIMRQGQEMGIKFKYHQNRHQHQKSNTECGMYSLFFTITMLTSRLGDEPTRMTAKQKMAIFSEKIIPDNVMISHRSIYFNND